MSDLVSKLGAIMSRPEPRVARARAAAECIRDAGRFHWVGLYDVTPEVITAVAWTGSRAPAYPTFPRAQGLSGAAVAAATSIMVNDVRADPRYLTTFEATGAEMVVPMLDAAGRIVGTIDIESPRPGAFGPADEALVQTAARVLGAQWVDAIHIREGGLDDPQVIALLHTHLVRAHAETARGSAHALDSAGLRSPDMTFWSAWEGHSLAGVGALKQLTADHGEVKSMHTAEAMRRRGVGGAILRHIIAVARTRGMSRLSLETGSWPYFAPARAFYAQHGFVECGPFGGYRPDANSVFMTLVLPS